MFGISGFKSSPAFQPRASGTYNIEQQHREPKGFLSSTSRGLHPYLPVRLVSFKKGFVKTVARNNVSSLFRHISLFHDILDQVFHISGHRLL